MKSSTLLLAMFIALAADARPAKKAEPVPSGEPSVVTAAIETFDAEIDMEGREYAVLRIGKKNDGTMIKAEVTDQSLAECRILTVNQAGDTVAADVIVSFEYENDGGYNSCEIEIKNGRKTYRVILGTAAGE